MFHLAYENLWAGKHHIDFINDEANSVIKTRGYSQSARVPSEYANSKWFLAINDIAYSYCPTNRYLYFRKIEKKRPSPTWASYKGRMIDEIVPHIYKKIYEYTINTPIRRMDLVKDAEDIFKEEIDKYRSDFNPDSLMDNPEADEVISFFNDLEILAHYEALMACALLKYRISNLYDTNIETEFKLLYPFDFKLKISSPSIGVSGSAEIDFLFRDSIMGEVKSGEWHDFYHIGLAGYALAYEADRKSAVNLGAVICPTFYSDRNVPIFRNTSNIKIIHEVWRKAFIRNRNSRMELVKQRLDPERPEVSDNCRGCGFYQECWET